MKAALTIGRRYYGHHKTCSTRKRDCFGLNKLPKTWRIYRCCHFELYVTSLFCWKCFDLELMKYNECWWDESAALTAFSRRWYSLSLKIARWFTECNKWSICTEKWNSYLYNWSDVHQNWHDQDKLSLFLKRLIVCMRVREKAGCGGVWCGGGDEDWGSRCLQGQRGRHRLSAPGQPGPAVLAFASAALCRGSGAGWGGGGG